MANGLTRRTFLKGTALTAALPSMHGGSVYGGENHSARRGDASSTEGIPSVTLNNGVKMPMLGFGTLHLGNAKETQRAVELALEVGFRLFDTAQSYANEEAVGAAFKATGVPRS